jgi:hypothetical protein
LQRSYLATVTATYRRLADLLIAQGRLAEAEQVLGLLKQQEYFDYVRRDATEALSVDGRANLNSEETEADKHYREIADRLVAIGAARGDLAAKATRTPEETLRLDQLEKDIAAGNHAFEKFLGDLAQSFSDKRAAALQVKEVREAQGMMDDLGELPPGTVAIVTLVGEEKFRAILFRANREVQPDPAGAGGPRTGAEHRQGRLDKTLEDVRRIHHSRGQHYAGGELQLSSEPRRDELRPVDGAHRGHQRVRLCHRQRPPAAGAAAEDCRVEQGH